MPRGEYPPVIPARRGRPPMRIARTFPAIQRVVRKEVKQLTRGSTNIAYTLQNAVNLATLGTGGGNVYHLTSLAQGDAEGTRTSNTITIDEIDLRFYISGSNTSLQLTAEPKVRVLLVRQHCPLGTVLTSASTLYSNIATNADMLMEPVPYWNIRKDIFTIMYDKVFDLQTAGVGGITAGVPDNFVLAETKVQKIKRKWKKGLQVTYAGTAGTTIQTNALYLMVLPQTTTMYINSLCRLIYRE